MNREEIGKRIEQVGIVPVVRAHSAEVAGRAARAIRAGGVEAIEIAMTVPDALSVLRQLASEGGDDLVLGAGTVVDADTARACIQAGAKFVVSPGLNLDTLRAVHELGGAMLPGALTPTEVITAWQAGAELVKVFPCSAVGGPKYLKALRAPLPRVRLLPTGGVDLDTAADYLAAGASALGVGAALVDLELLKHQGETALTERARQFIGIVQAFRSRSGSQRGHGPQPKPGTLSGVRANRAAR
jgi:2-dehydro-3-deoxyphosphogluconate aldolase/(4S)-4-hydroxy-2-oxoglutarate aldolase